MSLENHLQPAQPRSTSSTLSLFACSETNARENNEDSFIIFHLVPVASGQAITILALADGMGGHAYGELASSEALRRFSRFLFERLCLEPALNATVEASQLHLSQLEDALAAALRDANGYLRKIIESNQWEQAGCTLVAAAICGDLALVTNLGDSPLFHYDATTNELRKITDDHNESGVLLRAGLINKEIARVHEGRARLVHYIGMKELPAELPLHKVALAPGDRLLLCSDGVCGQLTEAKMQECVGAAGEPLAEVAAQLMAQARAAGEKDNQTVLLWQHPER